MALGGGRVEFESNSDMAAPMVGGAPEDSVFNGMWPKAQNLSSIWWKQKMIVDKDEDKCITDFLEY